MNPTPTTWQRRVDLLKSILNSLSSAASLLHLAYPHVASYLHHLAVVLHQ